jgi:hypothetical protein
VDAVQKFDVRCGSGKEALGALRQFAEAMVAYRGHPATQQTACDALLSFTSKCVGDITAPYY